MLFRNRVDEKLDFDLDRIEKNIELANFSTKTKLLLKEAVDSIKTKQIPAIMTENAFKNLSDVVVEILDVKEKLYRFIEIGDNCELLQQELNKEIERCTIKSSNELKLAISQCIMREIVEFDVRQIELYSRWREFAVEQRKLV